VSKPGLKAKDCLNYLKGKGVFQVLSPQGFLGHWDFLGHQDLLGVLGHLGLQGLLCPLESFESSGSNGLWWKIQSLNQVTPVTVRVESFVNMCAWRETINAKFYLSGLMCQPEFLI